MNSNLIGFSRPFFALKVLSSPITRLFQIKGLVDSRSMKVEHKILHQFVVCKQASFKLILCKISLSKFYHSLFNTNSINLLRNTYIVKKEQKLRIFFVYSSPIASGSTTVCTVSIYFKHGQLY